MIDRHTDGRKAFLVGFTPPTHPKVEKLDIWRES